jgi:hypothetical protein
MLIERICFARNNARTILVSTPKKCRPAKTIGTSNACGWPRARGPSFTFRFHFYPSALRHCGSTLRSPAASRCCPWSAASYAARLLHSPTIAPPPPASNNPIRCPPLAQLPLTCCGTAADGWTAGPAAVTRTRARRILCFLVNHKPDPSLARRLENVSSRLSRRRASCRSPSAASPGDLSCTTPSTVCRALRMETVRRASSGTLSVRPRCLWTLL